MACVEPSDIGQTLQDLILTDVISLDEELGRGAYGKVSTVKYREAIYAAKEIHSLLIEVADPKERQVIKNDFLRECYNCSILEHPNIVCFTGIYYPQMDSTCFPIMIMELMSDSLTNYVKKSPVTLKTKCSILHDVSQGLSYLHGHNPPVIHRDLSPNNILMSQELVAKISDLGVARVVRADSKMTQSKLTRAPGCVDFMPPEALECCPQYSTTLDIFSYGGIVLHVVNQEWPSPGSQVKRNPLNGKRTALSEIQRRKMYLDMMKDGGEVLKPLVKACLNDMPSKRPKITAVFRMLEPFRVIAEKSESTAANVPRLYNVQFEECQWPIVYKKSYNIGFLDIEKLQSFDAHKWGNVHQKLVSAKLLNKDQTNIVKPLKITDDELLLVHTQEYLNSMNSGGTVAKLLGIQALAAVPIFLLKKAVLNPLRRQTGGTILAGKLAKDRGWAINIGGGFHHCCSSTGGDFSIYADISLCVMFMLYHLDGINKVFILDLDAHQGNGFERDLGKDSRIFIFDVYNYSIYPSDEEAKSCIDMKIELPQTTSDDEYLKAIKERLPDALDQFKPDMVIYNAGTDLLEGDPLGKMKITGNGVKDRDELVFTEVKEKRRIPILMLLSGGFQRINAEVTANSIINLHTKGLISGPK